MSNIKIVCYEDIFIMWNDLQYDLYILLLF